MDTIQFFEGLLRDYGVWVVLVGTFLEGETIVVVAGFAAHHGYLNPYVVGAAAFAGSFAGDQFWFYMARTHRENRHVQKLTQRETFQRALQILERHPTLFILSFRFVYGVRNVSPIAIGFSGIGAVRFGVLNAIAAAVWATAFTGAGYLFSQTVETFLGQLKRVEHIALGALAAAAVAFIAFHVVQWIVMHVRRKNGKTE